MSEDQTFSPALFAFLAELRRNNNRDWFTANKARYEEVVMEPALDFVSDVGPLLAEVSPHFVADARRVGGSVFRIHRDIRFSKDKTPYKTHVGIHFRHESAASAHAPGYYLHLEPGNVLVGAGVWRPDAPMLGRIRERIAADPDEWSAALDDPAFADFALEGESLKRPPAGFDAGHPLIEDLKRKSFAGMTRLDEETVTAPGFTAAFVETCAGAAGFMRFLCTSVGVAY
jgi:uncharacterized protein (TIGR02453 family)